MNRYIKTVTLENFQSYKNQTVHFEPGLNLLLGTSDSGKSAILRAISFVLYNYPKKDTLIHWGETETKVTVEFSDGVKVTRIKGAERNGIEAYDADGKFIQKAKIDKEIPDDIKKLLGNPPQDDFNGLISYADQFSPMFLVDLSPTDLPRSLSNLTGIELLEESAKQLMSNYKALDKQNKADEKEYTNLLNESQLQVFNLIEHKELNEESSFLLDNFLNKLDDKLKCFSTYSNQVEDYKKLEQINISLASIKQKGEILTNEHQDMKNKLNEAETEYNEYKEFLIKEKIQCESCGSVLQ